MQVKDIELVFLFQIIRVLTRYDWCFFHALGPCHVLDDFLLNIVMDL